MKNELTAKAESLAPSGRMPITSAATSMSRVAIHERPIAPRVRFFATSAKTHTKASTRRYFSTGAVDRCSPKSSSGGAVTEPEDESLVNHLMRANSPVEEELRGERGHREVEALDAQARDAEEHAHQRRARARQQEDHEQVQVRDAHREVVRGVGPHRHEAAGAQRDLAAVAHQDVQARWRASERMRNGMRIARKRYSRGEQRHRRRRRTRGTPATKTRSCRIGKSCWSDAYVVLNWPVSR